MPPGHTLQVRPRSQVCVSRETPSKIPNTGRNSGSLAHAAGADTSRADADVLANAVDYRSDAAQVRIPAAPAHVVRVTDGVAVARLLAADFTCECHRFSQSSPSSDCNPLS